MTTPILSLYIALRLGYYDVFNLTWIGEAMGAFEQWVFVDKQGRIIEHVENDGPRFFRKGPEAENRVVTPEYVKQAYGAKEYKRVEDALGDHYIASM